MGSLGALPLGHFAGQFLLEYCTQKAKRFCIEFVSGMMHSLRKMLTKENVNKITPIPTTAQFLQEINGK